MRLLDPVSISKDIHLEMITAQSILNLLTPIRKNSAKSTFKIIQKSTRSKVFLEYRIKHAHISNNCTSYLCPTNKTLSATNVRFCCVLSLSSLNEQVSVVSLNEKFRVLTIFRKIWSEVVTISRGSPLSPLGMERRKFPYHLLNFPVSSLSSVRESELQMS